MVPRKGVDNVVRGFARLVSERRAAPDGGESTDRAASPEIRRLHEIAEEEGVSDGVSFVGPVGRDRPKYYFSAADVFATTPWYEPFGITPIEAMACGTPVVGSNVGGIKFTVRDGECGYLVPSNAPDVLAERLDHGGRARGIRLGAGDGAREGDFLVRRERLVAGLAAQFATPCPGQAAACGAPRSRRHARRRRSLQRRCRQGGADDRCPRCRKPAPDLVVRAARALGVEPHECAVIGDTGADSTRPRGRRSSDLVPNEVTLPQEVSAAPEVAPTLGDAVSILLGETRG